MDDTTCDSLKFQDCAHQCGSPNLYL